MLVTGPLTTPPTFPPVAPNALQNCFDAAWRSIAHNIRDEYVDDARSKLATFLLELAKLGQLTPAQFGHTASRTLRSPTISPGIGIQMI